MSAKYWMNVLFQFVYIVFYVIPSHTLRNINDWTIQLGITRRQSHSYYGEKVKIQRVVPHPAYNSEITHDNDIALFQVLGLSYKNNQTKIFIFLLVQLQARHSCRIP